LEYYNKYNNLSATKVALRPISYLVVRNLRSQTSPICETASIRCWQLCIN